jgi:hypothetical protein
MNIFVKALFVFFTEQTNRKIYDTATQKHYPHPHRR